MVKNMARPKLPDDEKRQLHSFRLDPADRKAVQEAAEAEGLSFPAAAEKYIKAGLALYRHPAMDEPTEKVFIAILDELYALQQRNKNHRWWKTAKAWAAANEVFKSGPFARLNPDKWNDDDAVNEAWRVVGEIRESKKNTISILQRLGITINPDTTLKHGNALLGMLGNAVDLRKSERAAIDGMENEEDRGVAIALFSVVERLDKEEAKAFEDWRAALRPFLQAEVEGEQLYKSYRQEVVKEQMARGQLPHYEDIL